MFHAYSSLTANRQTTYSLRSASRDLLATTRTQSVAFGHSAATTWNSIPFSICNYDTVTGFPCLLESPGVFPKISGTRKVLENEFGPGKFWNLPMVQLNQYAFYVYNTMCK